MLIIDVLSAINNTNNYVVAVELLGCNPNCTSPGTNIIGPTPCNPVIRPDTILRP